jgi:hypothetical protein
MGHPQWRNLPADPTKHQVYILRILETCSSTRVKSVIRTHTRQQDIEFRSNNYRQDAPIDSVPAKLGAAVQQRGEEADACAFCRTLGGPFATCVRIPGVQFGKCGNCIFAREVCSHGEGMSRLPAISFHQDKNSC